MRLWTMRLSSGGRRVGLAHPRADVGGQVFGVAPHAPDEGGRAAGQPGQAQEVESWHGGHAVLMHWVSLRVERVDVKPAEVERIAGGPDDRADAGFGQVELEDRV